MTLLHFSTDAIPAAARKEAVESVIAPHTGIGVDFFPDQPFSVDFKMRVLPGIQILAVSDSAEVLERLAGAVARPTDWFQMAFNVLHT